MGQKTAFAAVLALALVAGSLIATFSGHAGVGLATALVSIPIGGIGIGVASSGRAVGSYLNLGVLLAALIAVVIALLALTGTVA